MSYDHPPPAINVQLLRQARLDLDMSQAKFAEAILAAAERAGHKTRCTRRLIQKWESGAHRTVKPHYQQAIEAVTGIPFRKLCTPPIPIDEARISRQLEDIEAQLHHLAGRVATIAKTIRYSEP